MAPGSGQRRWPNGWSASYFHHRDHDPALFPDTLPCLDALHARYRLGLLSNGSRLPEKVGLARYFESVVFAQDHRVAKPDKGIFPRWSSRELGVEASRRLRPRGRPPTQRRRGGETCRLGRRVDRPGPGGGAFEPDPGCEERPDAVVTTLSDLPGALEALAAGADGNHS